MDGGGDFQLGAGKPLVLDGNIAVLVGVGAPQEADIQGEGGVEQVFRPVQLNELDHLPALGPGLSIGLAALAPGVGEGAQAHAGDHPRLLPGDGPEQLGHHAQGQGIGRQLVRRGHRADPGRVGQMPGDDGVDKPLPGDAVHAQVGLGVVSGADAGDHGESGGAARLLEPPGQGLQQGVRPAVGAEAPQGHGRSVLDQLRRLPRGDKVCHTSISFSQSTSNLPLIPDMHRKKDANPPNGGGKAESAGKCRKNRGRWAEKLGQKLYTAAACVLKSLHFLLTGRPELWYFASGRG